ncbi:hypothetical protein DRE_01110 [Drechslerella stenobrocha 248]|uniref:C2 domain-containing protein n=1 Tax=Drechslerella stenobrocha 248 TaxID=1043628 RepID=W7HME8_9PEZI|nr:hypothetical protein DRE_01110 [Drechslerella stenobrocha 248]
MADALGTGISSNDVISQTTTPNAAPEKARPQPPFDLLLTVCSASHVAVGDIHGTSDVYVIGKVKNVKGLVPGEAKSSRVHFRTSTHRATRDPRWDERWRFGGVREGTYLKMKVFDEDAKSRSDDKLGSIKLVLTDLEPLLDGQEHVRNIPIRRHKGQKHVQIFTAVFDFCNPDAHVKAPAPHITVKLQLLPSNSSDILHIHLQNPTCYSVHYSSLANLVATTPSRKQDTPQKTDSTTHSTSFKAYKISLIHPPPYPTLQFEADLAHAKAFDPSKFHYRVFRHLVRKQYQNIYGHDRNTVYGHWWNTDTVGPGLVELLQPVENKLFTFIITLDGEWRFCETGNEYKINHLSKHGMHADGKAKVVWAGEFFLRLDTIEDSDECDAAMYNPGGEKVDPTKRGLNRARRWRIYLDNDSGTYSPSNEKLGDFRDFMARNLQGIEVVVKNFEDEALNKGKEEQIGESENAEDEGQEKGKGKKPRRLIDILTEEAAKRVKQEQDRRREKLQEGEEETDGSKVK